MTNSLKTTLVAAALMAHAGTSQALDIQFDYSLDTQNFFTADKRQVLDQVASIYGRNITNSLPAINNLSFTQSMSNYDYTTWKYNVIPGSTITASHINIAADTLRIYVGAADLPDSTLGLAWVGTAKPSRTGAASGGFFGSGMGGQIMFDTTSSYVDYAHSSPGNYVYLEGARRWYADNDVRNFEHIVRDQKIPIVDPTTGKPTGQYWLTSADEGRVDFYSVAMHEMGHVFGLGHFENSSTAYGQSQTTAMGPSIASDTREYFTEADWTALRGLGWQVASLSPQLVVTAVPEPTSLAMLLGGLGVLVTARRRRAA